MTQRATFKELYFRYKAFEKYFFRADKATDRTTYLNLKNQFRLMVIFAFLGMLLATFLSLVHMYIHPLPFINFLAILIGFRLKSYNIPRIVMFVIMTVTPLKYYTSSLTLIAPISVLFTNTQVLVQMQSESLMIAHWVIQVLFVYFYGIDAMTNQLQNITKEELAEVVRATMLHAILLSLMNIVILRLYNSQFLNFLKKISSLTENLSMANNQLNDQNLKLQSNLEMKDVFIYTFSHELKNALNGLLGNLYLAYETAKDSQVIQFLSSARVCGEVLKNFVHNILDSGKLENGNLEVSRERKDVMVFMENLWTICGRIIQNKRVQGCLEIEKNVPRFLELDEQRMIQIILNLTSNAVKFTEKGSVRIHVSWQTTSTACGQEMPYEEILSPVQIQRQIRLNEEEGEVALSDDIHEFPKALAVSPSSSDQLHLVTEHQKKFIVDRPFYCLDLAKWQWSHEEVLSSKLPEGAKGILRIQVLDTGCGITPEDQAMLFQKYSQVNRLPGQRKIGTGLGLWICKQLAHRLGGDIKLRSALGVSSVFELKVPTRTAGLHENSYYQQPRNHENSNLSGGAMPEERTHNNGKILIADDDSFNIELIKNYLMKLGISYLCAHDGEEAVSLFKSHYQEICFVITDNFMPKKLGTEAALEIASFLEEVKSPKIPIMCISGDVKVNVGSKGITSVIQKPINFEKLKEELTIIYPQLNEKSDSRS